MRRKSVIFFSLNEKAEKTKETNMILRIIPFIVDYNRSECFVNLNLICSLLLGQSWMKPFAPFLRINE